MVLLGKKINVFLCIVICALLMSSFVNAEEVIRVQATPKVQAVNLAPMESNATVINLQPKQEQVINVQASPVSSGVTSNPSIEVKPATPTTVPVDKIIAPSNQKLQTPTSQTTPVDVSFDYCTKMFPTNAESLLILVLGAVEANGFTIKEFQSKGGYVTFVVQNKEFLATVAEIDGKNSMLKINPTNGVYHFAPGIVSKMFEYVDYKLTK